MPDTPALPPGVQLHDGETVLRSARDWGSSVSPLLLTNQRLICPVDPSGSGMAVIPLADIRSVRLRKPWMGFASVVVDYGDEQHASFPAHFDPERMRTEIAAAVERAARSLPAAGDSKPAADRYQRLRTIGELKASGVLTDAEFEAEKARILKEP
jgi:putative oligomerization/nucleic acid binding protein